MMRQLLAVLFKRRRAQDIRRPVRGQGSRFVRPDKKKYAKAVEHVIKENKEALIELGRK